MQILFGGGRPGGAIGTTRTGTTGKGGEVLLLLAAVDELGLGVVH